MTHAIATTSLSLSRVGSTTPATMSKRPRCKRTCVAGLRNICAVISSDSMASRRDKYFIATDVWPTTANRPMIGTSEKMNAKRLKVCGPVARAAKVKMLHERAPVAARVPAGITARRSKPLSLGNRLTRSNNITCYFLCGTLGQVYSIRSLLINMASISMSCGNCPTVFGTRALNSKPIERKYSIAPIKSGIPSYSLLTANSV
jgi:hypothetical protein